MLRGFRLLTAVAGAVALAMCAAPALHEQEVSAPALAAQMQRRPVVLLGEVHDNAQQHAVRAQALALLLQAGLRPALAFEQFDRERQSDIDRALSQTPTDGVDQVGRLVALGGRGWNWDLYRPFLELALQYRLPIVAANLSRADAMRVSKEGFGAVFDPAERRRLGLDRLPADLLQAQKEAIDEGHCHQMDEQMLPALARAQIARDATLAQAIGPYLQRGVILLTGNGHARRDIGVPRFLPPQQQDRIVSIALLERGTPADAVPPAAYDAVFWMPVQARADPCQSLRRMRVGGAGGEGSLQRTPQIIIFSPAKILSRR
jgi:uncharacterized iron-regulated protein